MQVLLPSAAGRRYPQQHDSSHRSQQRHDLRKHATELVDLQITVGLGILRSRSGGAETRPRAIQLR
jgi:hypothetical protein